MNGDFQITEIPAFITVHLGAPNSDAESVTVSFPDYIKGVGSASLSADIPPEALRALIYGQMTLTLNRIQERTYRKQGKSYDITSDPNYDQYYVYGVPVPEEINSEVNRLFGGYIAQGNDVKPIDVKICYTENERCRGMSVGGAIALSDRGYGYLDILKYYFGRDVYIAEDALVKGLSNALDVSYPQFSGSSGSNVTGLQIMLNYVGKSYTTIPYIENPDGIYGYETEESVRELQRLFNIEQSGIFDQKTYYALLYAFDRIKTLSDLVEQGIELSEIPTELRSELKYGSIGNSIKLLQYWLSFLSAFEERIPPLDVIGVFGEKTYRSVVAFQELFGLEPSGVVYSDTWNALNGVYEGLYDSLPEFIISDSAVDYYGNLLVLGSVGVDVRYLQLYLNKVAEYYTDNPSVEVNGEYDIATEASVRAFQELFGIKNTGVVSSTTWNRLSDVYDAIVLSEK